jgi:glycerol uptake facilitator-like aquaporin
MAGFAQAPDRRAAQLNVWRAVAAECLGTALLLCTVVGSGIMAERLSGGNQAIALLANTLATVFALVVLIETLGPVSGAHFNPVVTLLLKPPEHVQTAFLKAFWPVVPIFAHVVAALFIAAQLLGAVAGTWLAHAMFDLPLLQTSTKLRTGQGQWLAEAVATACLLFVIVRAGARTHGQLAPSGKVIDSAANQAMPTSVLVACTIGAAYWFTASTSFANPAAVLGRLLSDTFAGIAPQSAGPFVLCQLAGGVVGVAAARILQPAKP